MIDTSTCTSQALTMVMDGYHNKNATTSTNGMKNKHQIYQRSDKSNGRIPVVTDQNLTYSTGM